MSFCHNKQPFIPQVFLWLHFFKHFIYHLLNNPFSLLKRKQEKANFWSCSRCLPSVTDSISHRMTLFSPTESDRQADLHRPEYRHNGVSSVCFMSQSHCLFCSLIFTFRSSSLPFQYKSANTQLSVCKIYTSITIVCTVETRMYFVFCAY